MMITPKAGDRVSEYVLVEVVGRGTFGEVWKARHHIWDNQWVAVKIPTDLQYVRNLQKEGAAVHGLHHPNIVRAIGLDPFADPPYFVMEYIDGASLRQLIQRHPRGLPMPIVREVMRAVLRALDHAHANGVIHRDIKPENILICGGVDRSIDTVTAEDVRITDFGLGQAESVSAESMMQSGSVLAEAGKTIAGTIAYMAPEQREGQPADARSDLFSAGVMLFEMLTGERPGGSEMPGHLRNDLPAWADVLFARLYARRERRFASAAAALEGLESAMQPPKPDAVTPAAETPYRTLDDVERAASRGTCPRCNAVVSANDNFCSDCRFQLVAALRRCPVCDNLPGAEDSFCDQCGSRLAVSAA